MRICAAMDVRVLNKHVALVLQRLIFFLFILIMSDMPTQSHVLHVHCYINIGVIWEFPIFFTEKSTELKVVNWVIRYRVAIGVARGLAYLHHGCDPSIIHGDISSTNILLDHHFEPYISDFGLAKLLDSSDTHITATVGGTFGYIAPGTSCL